jgi:hypothetical protein
MARRRLGREHDRDRRDIAARQAARGEAVGDALGLVLAALVLVRRRWP